MTTKKLTKLLALYLPYILLGLVATNIGEAWRLAEGKELGDKIMSMMGTVPLAFANPLPSLHPLDLLVGLCCGAGLRLAVYLRGKNAKKYRHGIEYGSARWGTAKDIEPFMAPKFSDNIILTKTERLMMSNRPPDPKNARNKNVLVVGGSGSGKTRFWLKPNLLQCHSSYVVTDPNGIDMEKTQYSKLISAIPKPDIAISMGCNVSCPFIGRPFDENWGLDDPTGKSDDEFKAVIEQIRQNVLALKSKLCGSSF